MNTFRHWFMWSAIEVAPGRYDWRDYDRMMDLAARNGIKVVIAEMVTASPEWMFDKYGHARYQASDDSVVYSGISGSSATGGFPGLCLDNEDVRAAAEKFLTALAERYRNHPATLGYDLWNEHSAHHGSAQKMYCYCAATQAKFREWLRAKYGTVEALGRAWYRHSFADWAFVHPPRGLGGYPESLDWVEFRNDDAFRLLRWRAELFRRLDPKNRITAHGVAGTLENLPSANDEWRSAAEVETWGFTWVASRKGSEPWKQFHAVDLVRAGARGKPFWHAEAQAGPLWMQPQVVGRPREDGRITDEKDVRLWNLISMAGGATGIMYPRWRPLLDGPLWGAFGAFGMDGSVTPRAEMAGKVARWANAHPELWKSRPVKGEIGIVFVPESEEFSFVQDGTTQRYAQSARGAYQAFFDSNIQADFVHVDDIREYPVVYLPYPLMLKAATAHQLIDYVEGGGKLISEGCPAYFGDRGKVGTVQPNLGLDKLFGARESYVEFTPDLLEDLVLTAGEKQIGGRYFIQEYRAEGGRAVGQYANGHVAAVENAAGKGRVLLIGTFPGAAYHLHHSAATREFFAGLLAWAGAAQQVTSSDAEVKARLHRGAGGTYVWVVNPTRTKRNAVITLPGRFSKAVDLWAGSGPVVEGNRLMLFVEERNVAVIRLE
jgi:beta-galactosidase